MTDDQLLAWLDREAVPVGYPGAERCLYGRAADRIRALIRERDGALKTGAGIAREYWQAVIAGHGHIPIDPTDAMTKAAQEIEAAILWEHTKREGDRK